MAKKSKNGDLDDDMFDGSVDFIEEEDQLIKRKMIHLIDADVVFPVYAIETIQKTQKFVDNCNPMRWMYGVVINKGLEDSVGKGGLVKGMVEIWYMSQELADQAFDRIITVMEVNGSKIVKM